MASLSGAPEDGSGPPPGVSFRSSRERPQPGAAAPDRGGELRPGRPGTRPVAPAPPELPARLGPGPALLRRGRRRRVPGHLRVGPGPVPALVPVRGPVRGRLPGDGDRLP